jgi:predicted nucleotidyltransferase
MVNEEIKAITAKFVSALNPKSVYLFGSYARGDYNDESDYDFYIVMPGKRKVTCNTTAKAYMSLTGMKRRPVDIIVNNEADFAERSTCFSALEETVVKEGVRLYEK